MEELISLSIDLHVIFILLLIVLIAMMLYLLRSEQDFLRISKKLELITPQYYIVLTAIFFTGLIVWAVTKFTFSLSILVMVAMWLYSIVFGIRNYKVYKKMQKINLIEQDNYKQLARKKYAIELGLLLAVSILAYGLH